jgi:hypothetical protein
MDLIDLLEHLPLILVIISMISISLLMHLRSRPTQLQGAGGILKINLPKIQQLETVPINQKAGVC